MTRRSVGQVEEGFGCGGYGGGEVIEVHLFQVGEEFCGVDHEGGFVYPLLTHRLRGHIGTVGFEH